MGEAVLGNLINFLLNLQTALLGSQVLGLTWDFVLEECSASISRGEDEGGVVHIYTMGWYSPPGVLTSISRGVDEGGVVHVYTMGWYSPPEVLTSISRGGDEGGVVHVYTMGWYSPPGVLNFHQHRSR